MLIYGPDGKKRTMARLSLNIGSSGELGLRSYICKSVRWTFALLDLRNISICRSQVTSDSFNPTCCKRWLLWIKPPTQRESNMFATHVNSLTSGLETDDSRCGRLASSFPKCQLILQLQGYGLSREKGLAPLPIPRPGGDGMDAVQDVLADIQLTSSARWKCCVCSASQNLCFFYVLNLTETELASCPCRHEQVGEVGQLHILLP